MSGPDERKNYWPQIATALISAAATIGVAWIGVLPLLQEQNLTKIDSLTKQADDLNAEANKSKAKTADLEKQLNELRDRMTLYEDPSVIENDNLSSDTWVVTGLISDLSNEENPVRNAQITLVPASMKLSAFTDDTGQFVITGVPQGWYNIFIQSPGPTLDKIVAAANEKKNDTIELNQNNRVIYYSVKQENTQ